MPWRPPVHRAHPSARVASDAAYARKRRAQHGPDPRSTARWQRVRALVLARQPLCADPYGVHAALGDVVPATEVDHMQGVWEAPSLVFSLENLQGLCENCHAIKTAHERRRTPHAPV